MSIRRGFSMSGGGGGGAPSGPAGGDLSGTYPDPTIANSAVTDVKVSATAAIAGTKIAPDFGAQDITTTGDIRINDATPFLRLGLIAGSGAGSAASAGAIALPNGATTGIQFRNNTDTGDVRGLDLATTTLTLGSGHTGTTIVNGGSLILSVSGATKVSIGTSTWQFEAGMPTLQWQFTAVSPTIKQLDDSTASITGDTLLVQAQNATGTTATGGALDLRSGTGTTAAGEISLAVGATKRVRANATGLGFFGVAPVARPSAYTPTNVTSDRSYDADTVAIAELADVVGTLIADLQGLGLLQ